MKARALLVVALLAPGCALGVPDSPDEAALLNQALGPYFGVWESPGYRQVFVPEGARVTACLLERDEAGWTLASRGHYAAGEGDVPISGTFSGSEAMGFDRLDVVVHPVEDGGLDFVNTAISQQGRVITWETWSEPQAGAFDYVVERTGPEGREFWFGGRWERVRDAQPAACPGES